jgi:thiopeptide-type bacteriocin biosynthesis protein
LAESDWVSGHAFYHGELDGLLLEAIRPLLDELTADDALGRWFFLRHWEGGPHVRLRVLPATPARRTDIEGLIRSHLDRFFVARAAPDRITQEEYSRIAGRLARVEGLGSYARALHPNNRLAFIAYRQEHLRYGHGAALCAVERHFTESSGIALDSIGRAASMDLRAVAAYCMLLLAWFAGECDPTALAGRLGRSAARFGETGHGDGLPGSTAQGSGHAVERAVELAMQMRVLGSRGHVLRRQGALVDWARSVATLHDALAAEAWSPDRTFDVLDSSAHLICNRLGLSLSSEGDVRRLAARAVRVLADEGG